MDSEHGSIIMLMHSGTIISLTFYEINETNSALNLYRVNIITQLDFPGTAEQQPKVILF